MNNPYQLGKEARQRNSNLSFNPYWQKQFKKSHFAWELGWFEEDWKIWGEKKKVKDKVKSVKREIFMSVEEVLKEINSGY